MSKKKYKDSKLTGNGSVLSIIKEHTTKKGKLKGKNKQETKILKGACPHHTINKHGKIKPTLTPNGKGWYICRLCGAYVKPTTYSKDEAADKLKGAIELDNNMKYLAVAVNGGENAVRFSSELGSMLNVCGKTYRKLAKIAEKNEQIKKKKKKDRQGGSLGSWK